MPNQSNSVKKFALTFTVNTTLTEDDLVNANLPASPSVEDVKALIEQHGGIYRVLHDWNLLIDSNYSVTEVP